MDSQVNTKLVNRGVKLLGASLLLATLSLSTKVLAEETVPDNAAGVPTSKISQSVTPATNNELETEADSKGLTVQYDGSSPEIQNGQTVTVTDNQADKNLQAAADQAKNSGVQVIQEDTQTVEAPENTLNSAQSTIQRDYVSQEATLKAAQDKQVQNKADYDEALKNIDYSTSTEWSQEQLKQFFNGEEANTTYLKANTAQDGKKTTLEVNAKSLPKDQVHQLINEGLFPAGTADLKVNDDGSLETGDYHFKGAYRLKNGLTWVYRNVATDAKTGRNIDLNYELTGYYSVRQEHSEYLLIDSDNLGIDLRGTQVDLRVTPTYSDTGEKATITALLGFSDIDRNESVFIDHKGLPVLTGSNIVPIESGFDTKDYNSLLRTDPRAQIWMLLKDINSFRYSFGAGDDAYSSLGIVDFAVNLPILKHEKVSYHLTKATIVADSSTVVMDPEQTEVAVPSIASPSQAQPVQTVQIPVTYVMALDQSQPAQAVVQEKIKAKLPETGEAKSVLAEVIGLLLTTMGLVHFLPKKGACQD